MALNDIKEKTKVIASTLKEKTEETVGRTGFDLVTGWHKFYKMYSIWFFALLGSAPDLYNLAISSGVIDAGSAPALLTRIINIIAFVGAASRLLKQKKLTEGETNEGGPPYSSPPN